MGSDDACSCDEPDLVATMDRNLKQPYVSGNPHCRFCRNCNRRYFCKPGFWKKAAERFVIPNGGEEPVHVDELDENFFECPKCGEPHFGEPEECDTCEAEYNW